MDLEGVVDVGVRAGRGEVEAGRVGGGGARAGVGEADAGELCETQVSTTFNHASFDCTGKREFEARLAGRGIEYRTASVPLTGQAQLFFRDPAGNGVELQFASEEDDAAQGALAVGRT